LEGEKARILEIQEEASKKLARDLHDGPAQAIAGIAMRIDVARRLFKQNPEDGDKELAGILELARRTTQEIRHMLFTLRPLVLETEGLAVALKTMAAKMSDTYQQNVSVNTDPAIVERLETNKQTVIFYIAEEAVNNARKHAKASKIIVSLKSSRQYIDLAELWIEDNGVGFNVESVTENYHTRGSLGLVNLRERADLLNGAISIQSAPGQGTTIKVLIPLNQEAADRLLQNL
jgi:signal transduction histidine kinase